MEKTYLDSYINLVALAKRLFARPTKLLFYEFCKSLI